MATTATAKIMRDPWIPTAVLYQALLENTSRSGVRSSARMSRATRPAATRAKAAVTRYWIPITLWSVL